MLGRRIEAVIRAEIQTIRAALPRDVGYGDNNALVITDALDCTFTLPWSLVPTYDVSRSTFFALKCHGQHHSYDRNYKVCWLNTSEGKLGKATSRRENFALHEPKGGPSFPAMTGKYL